MMKKGRVILKTGVLTAIILISMIFGRDVWAAGSVSITSSAENIGIEEEFSVTIKAVNPEGSAEKPQISVEYDIAKVKFSSCDKSYGGGGGGLITLTDTSATIKFEGVSAGSTKIKVSAILDGDGADVPTGEVTIGIGTEEEQAAAGAESVSQDGVAVSSNIAEGLITVGDGAMMLSTTFPEEIMLNGFHKEEYNYKEQMVEAAVFDMGTLTLLYMTDESGTNGNFYIYEPETDTFSDFVYIQGIEGSYIIISQPDESIVVPEGFAKATLQWNGKSALAYMITGASTLSDNSEEASGEVTKDGISTSDFFLLYALNSEGKTGWYLYDMKEGTYQRYLERGVSTKTEAPVFDIFNAADNGSSSSMDPKFIVICIMAVVILILMVLLVVLFIKLKDYLGYEYIDEDEDKDEDEDENGEGNHSGNNSSYYKQQPIMTSDEMRARRYETDGELGESGELYSEDFSQTTDMDIEQVVMLSSLSSENEGKKEQIKEKQKPKEKKRSRLAQWYVGDEYGDDDDEEDNDGEDDDDEMEDGNGNASSERRSLFGRRKSKQEPKVEAHQLDWSEMRNEIHVSEPDERRPTTSKSRMPISSPHMTVTEPPATSQARPYTGQPMPADSLVSQPIPRQPMPRQQMQPEYQQQPMPRQSMPPQQPVQPQYQQQPIPRQSMSQQPVQPQYQQQPMSRQSMAQQPVQPEYQQQLMSRQSMAQQPIQPEYQQQPISQGYDQQLQYQKTEARPRDPFYEQQGNQMGQPYTGQTVKQPIQQPVQQPVQQPEFKLDDDFEFEFIDMN